MESFVQLIFSRKRSNFAWGIVGMEGEPEGFGNCVVGSREPTTGRLIDRKCKMVSCLGSGECRVTRRKVVEGAKKRSRFVRLDHSREGKRERSAARWRTVITQAIKCRAYSLPRKATW